jgi:hypothetical protein
MLNCYVEILVGPIVSSVRADNIKANNALLVHAMFEEQVQRSLWLVSCR